MHILFIPTWFETPDRPSAGKAVKDLAYALALEGIKVNILFQSGAHFPLITKLNHQVEVWHSHSAWPGKLFPIWNLASLWSYHRVFKQYIRLHGKPDLIHIHSYPLLSFAHFIFRKYGIRTVYTEHSSKVAQKKLNLPERLLIKQYTGNSVRVVCVSDYLKTGLKKNLPGTDIKVIPNTVDFNYFLPGTKSSTPQLIMINLLNKNKQVDLGIQVFALWVKQHPEAQLHIIGDGPEKSSLEQLVTDLGLKNKVIWWGEKKAEEWLPQLRSSTALLLLSRSETFGVVVVEALACGVPVVSLENRGIEAMMMNSHIPILPVDAHAEQIADALDKVLDKFDRDAVQVRNELRLRFDYPAVARQYINLYHELLNPAP